VHTVTTPIIQELREVVVPQRFIRQEVLPVQEDIQTNVARGVNVGGGFVGGLAGGIVGDFNGFGGNFFRR